MHDVQQILAGGFDQRLVANRVISLAAQGAGTAFPGRFNAVGGLSSMTACQLRVAILGSWADR